MKKLIIFDLDGTLIDTLEDLTDSVNHAISRFNFPIRSLNDIRLAIGNGVSKLVARSIPNAENNPLYTKCLKEFISYYKTHSQVKTKPYKGLIEPLKELKSLGYKLAVCTNKDDNIAKELIYMHFPGIFDFVQGEIAGISKKPNPEMINLIINHFNLENDEVIYIGDTEVDEETATNSLIDYYLVTYGFRTKEELNKKCPNAKTIDKIDQIKTLHNSN